MANICPAVPSRRHSVSAKYADNHPLKETNLLNNPPALMITAPVFLLLIIPLWPDSPVMGMCVNRTEHINEEWPSTILIIAPFITSHRINCPAL